MSRGVIDAPVGGVDRPSPTGPMAKEFAKLPFPATHIGSQTG